MRPCDWGKTLYWVWSMKIYFLFISSTILWCVFRWKCSRSRCLHIVTPYVQLRSVVIKLTLSSSRLTLMRGSAWLEGIRFGSREKMIPQKPRAISAPDVRGEACFGRIEQLTGWLSCMLLTVVLSGNGGQQPNSCDAPFRSPDSTARQRVQIIALFPSSTKCT